MTADSPASGLPQEAVKRRGPLAQRLRTLAKIADATEGRIHVDCGTLHDAADAVLALAAERVKVAALQQELTQARRDSDEWMNKSIEAHGRYLSLYRRVRELHVEGGGVRIRQCVHCDVLYPCPTVALLPDVQADDSEWLARNVSAATGYSRAELDELGGFRADDSGTCTCTPEWKSHQDSHDGYCPATVVQPPGTAGECPGCGVRPCVCNTVVLDRPGQPAKGEQSTPATTCAACGTTRTICDAGLNTYDNRCCEQCGHGEGVSISREQIKRPFGMFIPCPKCDPAVYEHADVYECDHGGRT